jgi:hypothetical protein
VINGCQNGAGVVEEHAPRRKQGMALTVVPMLNLGSAAILSLEERWTIVTADGSLSAQRERTVVVSRDGCDLMTQLGRSPLRRRHVARTFPRRRLPAEDVQPIWTFFVPIERRVLQCRAMSDALETVAVILQALSARYKVLSNAIRVPRAADDGFEVTLYKRQSGWLVHYDGWHEEIASDESAVRAFFFGLSEAARLKVTSHGNVDHKWGLESLEGDEWSPDSETGLLFFPFWSAKRVRYLQNHLLPTDWNGRLAELGAAERKRKTREQGSSE